MGDPARMPDVNPFPEDYGPKKPPLSFLLRGSAYPSDTIPDPFQGGEPPRTSNRIRNYRRIGNWENFFLDSAICSVAKALGEEIDDFHFFSAITGDMFAYLYSLSHPCDSGITNYFVVPQVVKKAFAAIGYSCRYLSNAQIQEDFSTVMNAIRDSVDQGIPVLAWGMGNVITADGSHWDPLPEGCLIGGYDRDDVLYVNLYLGPERATVDEDGYTAVTRGLDTTMGLFFIGDKLDKPDMREIYREVLHTIPAFLSLPPTNGYCFGREAFELWANTLTEETRFQGKTDKDLSGLCWDLHCSPYCAVCTTDSASYIRRIVETYPDLTMAVKLLPLYEEIWRLKDEIWAYQGDFFPPMNRFRERSFRAHISGLLRRMGSVCDEILKLYEEAL